MKAIARACAAAGLLAAGAAPCIDLADEHLYASNAARQETDRLRATVRPRIGYAPAMVIIEALVEPANENRFLDFVVDSGEYYRSSTVELIGVRAPRVSVVRFSAVPAGTYDVLVTVREETGKVLARLHERLLVKDRGGL